MGKKRPVKTKAVIVKRRILFIEYLSEAIPHKTVENEEIITLIAPKTVKN
jgi:hypothetical protein